MVVRMALVQFESEQFAPEANLAKAGRFVAQAAEAGAQIAVFPEDFVTGPISARLDLADDVATRATGSPSHAECKDIRPSGRRVRRSRVAEEALAREPRTAHDDWHAGRVPYREAFRALARRHAIDLIPGSVIEREGERLFNTAYYIDARGEVLARYRKVNLWLAEKPWCTPGDGAAVCETRWGKVGLAICWDLAFPELFRDMLARGVEIAVCPSCWCLEDAGSGVRHNPNAEVAFVDSLCVARAFENEIVVAFCNAAGGFGGAKGACHSIGHTQVAVPFKGAVAMVAHPREEMLVCEVDTSILAEAEVSYEIRKDLRTKGKRP